MDIVRKIRALCDSENLTFNSLEKKIGLSRGSIARWNDNLPSIDKVQKVADYFNVSIDSLMGRTEPTPSDITIDEETPVPQNKVRFTVNPYGGEQEVFEIPAEDFENTYIMLKAIADKEKNAGKEIEARRERERKAAKKGFFNWNK